MPHVKFRPMRYFPSHATRFVPDSNGTRLLCAVQTATEPTQPIPDVGPFASHSPPTVKGHDQSDPIRFDPFRSRPVASAACINTLDNYLASCAYNFTQLNYGVLDAFANQLSNDCSLNFNAKERALAATYCSSAFDHIVGFSQSALNPAVIVSGGVMIMPYSCLLADYMSCPAARPPPRLLHCIADVLIDACLPMLYVADST